MKKLLNILAIFLLFGCSNQNQKKSTSDLTTHIVQQMDYAIKLAEPLKDSVLVSPRNIKNGKLKLVRSSDWISGFFPGNLWMIYELSGFSDNGDKYITVANKLLETLTSSNFLSPVGENRGFLLYHSTGHLPLNSEIDVPIVYADYYFLESIIKKKNMEKNN